MLEVYHQVLSLVLRKGRTVNLFPQTTNSHGSGMKGLRDVVYSEGLFPIQMSLHKHLWSFSPETYS
jgi:hypothetical protein